MIAQVRSLYERANVFEKAAKLVDKYQERAEKIADEVSNEELRRLLYYLIDTVLERPSEATSDVQVFPIVATPTR